LLAAWSKAHGWVLKKNEKNNVMNWSRLTAMFEGLPPAGIAGK
jgi:hypothetical protein